MNIYELSKDVVEAFENYMSCFDQDTFELIAPEEVQKELFGKLEQLQNKSNEVTEWVLATRQNSIARQDMLASEISRLSDQAKKESKTIEKMEKLFEMLHPELEKPTVFGNWTASYRKSEAVNITDIEKIPEEFMVVKAPPPPAPDKAEIKRTLKEGGEVPGAEIEVRFNLQIK